MSLLWLGIAYLAGILSTIGAAVLAAALLLFPELRGKKWRWW